jgi:diacylglycerol kinase (ATP)
VKPLCVVNPKSGGGRPGQVLSELRATIERALGDVDVAVTERGGHAIELAEAGAREGRELVIAVGGDGTLSEVVNGVMRSGRAKECHVALVGQGTGGDFRKTLGIEHRLDRYLEAIGSERTRTLDVGKATFRLTGSPPDAERATRYFVNILSAGMGGLVDQYVATGSRVLGGTAAYFMASTKALLRARPGQLQCRVDGGTTPIRLRSYMIAICNGQYFGSGMHVAPMAKLDDGVFEVVSMDAPNKLAFAAFSQKIYSGAHMRSEHVRHFPCKSISLDLDNEDARDRFLLDIDGEPIGGLPLEVEVLPGALTLRG